MFQLLQQHLDRLLWQTDLKQAGRIKAFFIRMLRIFYGTARDLGGGLPSLRAMGLVYTTLLSIVPLLAVSFSVLKGFGVHNQLEPVLVSMLEPLGEKGLQISQQIIEFVDNIKVGVLGAIGLAVLIFTVLSLVKKIESAFNHTWRISTNRSFVQRFSNYLSVILLGPVLLFASAGLTASFNSSAFVERILGIEPFGSLLLLAGEAIPYLLTAALFTFIFVLVPNTRVRIRSAIYGAVVATILWKISGAIFTTFIVNSTNYTAIYSGFAILIIFMLWIYAGWLIVLTGSSIAYYHQNPDRISDSSQVIRLSCRLREKLAFTLMQLIADSFQHNKPPWSLKTLARETGVSEDAIKLILSSLAAAGLLVTSGKKDQVYLPATSLDNISLQRILQAARSAEETPLLQPEQVKAGEQTSRAISQLEEAMQQSLSGLTLLDLIAKK